MSLSIFVKIYDGESNNLLTLLVDTGADISLLKQTSIEYKKINKYKITTISGIGEGTIQSLGTTHLELCNKYYFIPHEFHVVHENFPIPCDGILGMDFIKHYNCILDFNETQDWFILRPQNVRDGVHIPILHYSTNDTILLPARSEVIRQVRLNTPYDEVLVVNQEPRPGVIIGNTIVKSKRAFIRVINTNTVAVSLKCIDIISENLDNYTTSPTQNCIETRKVEIMKTLSKSFPEPFKKQMATLCIDYIDIFGLDTEPITANNFYTQKFKLKDKEPVYIKNYRIPHTHKVEVDTQVKKLIEDGIVEPSTSEYNSPLLLVPKKSLPNSDKKRWRLVVDYRQINKKLIADKFPLPRIEDILDQLGRAKYFSCLDLMSGFHQIELDEMSRDITSFSTSNGSYRFKRLPYGLKIAPNSFQRMMTIAFSGLEPSQAFLYMDDLVVIGRSEKQMLNNLKSVFDLCRKFNLKLHPGKCSFFRHEVIFLGHKCTDEGILPDDGKYEVIKKYPVPTDANSARRFIAFCNYYRRFIKNFSLHSRHITRLCKKNVPFEWTEECNNAFLYLKKALMLPTLLQYPNFDKEFCITTDASKYACGAVLSQEYNGKQLPVAFASKTFTQGESNKSTIEQELIAIHWAILHFRPYIYGKRFLVKSDHRPLSYLFSMKNPSSKLTRMRLDLEEYDFVVEYLKGKENYVADALSRISIDELKELNENVLLINKVTTRSDTRQRKTSREQKHHNNENNKPNIYEVIQYDDVKKLVKLILTPGRCLLKHGKLILKRINIEDMCINGKLDLGGFFPRLEKEASMLNLDKLKMAPDEEIFKFVSINEFKRMGNKILRKLTVALLPKVTIIDAEDENKIKGILTTYHDNPAEGGHCGISRTLAKIRRHYKWRGMVSHVKKYVKTCEKCQKSKITIHTKTPMILTQTPATAFDVVLVDTIGPLPKTENGNEYIVTLICDLTKYLVTIPIPNKSANTVARAIFEYFVLCYGPMKTFISDMGTEYKNSIITDLCKYMKIENISSTAYHHQTLGTVERSHRTFNEYIRSYISIERDDWDEWLRYFTYCFNTTPSAVHGYCPYELVYGRIPHGFHYFNSIDRIDPIYNIDDYSKEVKYRLEIAYKRARLLLDSAKVKRKEHYDMNTEQLDLNLGDLVLLRNEVGHKLENRYEGPYKVIEIRDNDNIIIEIKGNRKQKVHKNRLKLFNEGK